MSRAFAGEGASVAVLDIDANAAEQTVQADGKACAYACDVSDEAAVTTTFSAVDDDLGPVDVLINNAGIGSQRRDVAQRLLARAQAATTGSPDDSLRATSMLRLTEFDRMLRVHVYGTFLCSREALRRMEDRRSGVILNITSVAGILGLPGEHRIFRGQGRLIAMTKSLSQEVVAAGIRVNAIAPGWIDTPMVSERVNPQFLQVALTAVGMRRLGRPEEVAALALHLCSDEAGYTTGQIISPNGGIPM
jgi:3-oxoacyl-[acyl-carrier protein] reductase